jgi:hypothetical protein
LYTRTFARLCKGHRNAATNLAHSHFTIYTMNDGSTILFDKTVPFPMEKKGKGN